MGGVRLMEHLWYVYGPLEGRMACTAYYPAMVVKLTNHNFLSPGWKIAIGSLSTSALAALKIRLTASLEYRLEGSPEDTLRGGRFPMYFLYVLWFYFLCISSVFYGFIEAIMEAVHRWFHFSSTASV